MASYRKRKNNIAPYFGDKKLSLIKAIEVQEFYNTLEDKLSPATIKNIHNLLKPFFKHAVKWEYLKKNIMDHVTTPKVKQKEMQVWTPEEASRFLASAKDSSFYLVYLLALHCGLRRGEILALRWKCVDLENKKININLSLVVNGGEIVFEEPKTKGSNRNVAISPLIVEELKKHQSRQIALTELVFNTSNGTPYHPRNLLRDFYQQIEEAKVNRIRFHDLRHTHATLLLKSGENIKVISERLGHSKSSFTLDVYSHVLPDMQQQAADKMVELLK